MGGPERFWAESAAERSAHARVPVHGKTSRAPVVDQPRGFDLQAVGVCGLPRIRSRVAHSQPRHLNFAAIAALFTWAMTLVIQRAQHRDTQAIHAKLDELLRVHGEARNELTSLDDEDAEEVEKKRDQIRDRIRSQ